MSLHGLEEEVPSIGAELLASIRQAFDARRTDRLSTADLLETLAEDEEAPWAAWNRGKPMTPHQLSNRLAEFGIKSNTVRINMRTPKGYRLEQFTEAFERYLSADSPVTTATTPQPRNYVAYKDFDGATTAAAVADEKSLQTSNHKACCGVADQKGGSVEDYVESF